jgi:hypothetical protein
MIPTYDFRVWKFNNNKNAVIWDVKPWNLLDIFKTLQGKLFPFQHTSFVYHDDVDSRFVW